MGFTEEQLKNIHKLSKKKYDRDELYFNSVKENLLNILEYCLQRLFSNSAFKNSKADFKKKLLNETQIVDTITELVIGTLLEENKIVINDFEFKYQYSPDSDNKKDFDIFANFNGNNYYIEIFTRREFRFNRFQRSPNIDRMIFQRIRRKYIEEKQIINAVNSGYLSQNPIIFVVNTQKSLKQGFFNNHFDLLTGCNLLCGILIFSGFVFQNGSLRLNEESNIYFYSGCKPSISSLVDKEYLRLLLNKFRVIKV